MPSSGSRSVEPEAPVVVMSQAERAARALAEGRQQVVPFELQLLSATLDYGSTLRTVAAALVPRFADWAFIHLVDEGGIARRVRVAHADPARAALAARFRHLVPGPGWATLTAQAIRDGAPRLVRTVTEEVLRWAAHDDQHLAALRALAPHSILVLPLPARDRIIGGITLMRAAHVPGFSEEDLVEAQKIAAPAALALDNARTVAAERYAHVMSAEAADIARHARHEAEEGLLRLRRLQSIAGSLASSLVPEAIGRILFDNALSTLPAKTGTLALAHPDGNLSIAYAFGWPHDLLEQWRTFRSDARSLVAEAFRTRTPLWIDSPDALAQVYPSLLELPLARGENAWAAVPLVVDGQAVGAIGLGFAERRRLEDGDREYVVACAAIAAQAVARARLRDR